jgi:hypothetical protein
MHFSSMDGDRRMRLSAFCLTACLIATSPVLAHPGHGVTAGDSAVHYLIEPLHIGPVLLLLAAGFTTTLWLKRRNKSLRHEHARKPRSGA